MIKKTYDVGCHGLLIGQPVDELIAFLNAQTPDGIHFDAAGGADPRPQEGQIIQNLIARARAGFLPIFIGHSLGAMLAFYAAMALKAAGIRSPLFVSIDPTCWGTNAPGVPEWSEVVLAPNTGRYFVPDNVDTWLHFNQDGYPGGGHASLAPGNTTTSLCPMEFPGENHLSNVNCAPVRTAILRAVLVAAA